MCSQGPCRYNMSLQPFSGVDYLSKERKMNYQENGINDAYRNEAMNYASGLIPDLMGASSLFSHDVYNRSGENLGGIKELVLDVANGRIAYAVLAYGGFLGMGRKRLVVPWNALKLDIEHERFTLNLERDELKTVPGFDKSDWPNMSDKAWEKTIYDYYGIVLDSDMRI